MARCSSIKSRRLALVLNLRFIRITSTLMLPRADKTNKILQEEDVDEIDAEIHLVYSSMNRTKQTCKQLSTRDVPRWRPCGRDVRRCRWVVSPLTTWASKLLLPTCQFPSSWNFDRQESSQNLAFQSFVDEWQANTNWHQTSCCWKNRVFFFTRVYAWTSFTSVHIFFVGISLQFTCSKLL